MTAAIDARRGLAHPTRTVKVVHELVLTQSKLSEWGRDGGAPEDHRHDLRLAPRASG